MTEFVDRTLTCKDCSEQFVFSAGEQEFYKDKRLTNTPARCKRCRVAKRARIEQAPDKPLEAYPEGFQYPVKCSQCGTETTVPFVPHQGRPVYCRPCFQATKEAQVT